MNNQQLITFGLAFGYVVLGSPLLAVLWVLLAVFVLDVDTFGTGAFLFFMAFIVSKFYKGIK